MAERLDICSSGCDHELCSVGLSNLAQGSDVCLSSHRQFAAEHADDGLLPVEEAQASTRLLQRKSRALGANRERGRVTHVAVAFFWFCDCPGGPGESILRH